jgi:predicted PurR-regulated permease PerM
MESTNTNWSKPTSYIAGVGLALFGIFVLYLSRSVIPLLIIAVLLAIIVRPLILWLHNKVHMSFGLAVLVVYLIVAVLLPLALLLAIPAILDTVRYILSLDYSAILQDVIAWLHSTLNAIKALPISSKILNLYVDQTIDSLLQTIDQITVAPPQPASVDTMIQSLTTALSTTFQTAAGVLASLLSGFGLMLFTFMASLFITLGADRYREAILRAIPDRFRSEVTILIAKIEQTWKAFFQGELILMLFIGVISWLGLTILGIPGAFYLGMIAGLCEFLPNIGPTLAMIPAVIVALTQGSTILQVSPLFMACIVILFYILVQQFENNLISPRVLGKALDLPALVVMTGALVGAEVGGLLGLLIATPVIATFRDIVGYVYRKILGENPFPPKEAQTTATPILKTGGRKVSHPIFRGISGFARHTPKNRS